jgi:hypothetical protein
MAGFARFLGLEVESLYFWLYGRAIKPYETISNVCYTYSPFIPVLLITAYTVNCEISFTLFFFSFLKSLLYLAAYVSAMQRTLYRYNSRLVNLLLLPP